VGNNPGKWRVLLNDEDAARAKFITDQIAESLLGEGTSNIGPSLATGKAGIALFFAYYHKSTAHKTSGSDLIALQLLNEAIEEIGQTNMHYGFLEGVCGVAWAIHHISAMLGSPASSDSTHAVDSVIYELLKKQVSWENSYDLIHGLVGIGVYALERLPLEIGQDLAHLVVLRLMEAATHNSDDGPWLRRGPKGQFSREVEKKSFFDLGMPTGIPGVIAFLSLAIRNNISVAESSRMLQRAVSWLLKQRRPAKAPSCYPLAVGHALEDKDAAPAARPFIGWCYGDTGISAALLLATQSLERPEWRREALRVARHAASMTTEKVTYNDACICHGAAGVGHIFNRLSQYSGELFLARAAHRWLKIALSEPIVNGTSIFRFEFDGVVGRSSGFLRGSAGVGLSLLAAVRNEEPQWDRALLLSTI